MTEGRQNDVFNDWLNQHKGIFFKITRAYTTDSADQEDLFQEISVQVWRSVPKFRNNCAVTTWIYRIALNTALKWSSRERKHQEGKEEIKAGESILTDKSDQMDDRLGWLYEQIALLDKVDRSLCLLLLDGFSYKEMAEIIGISESYVGVKINRIKKHLTRQSEKMEHGI